MWNLKKNLSRTQSRSVPWSGFVSSRCTDGKEIFESIVKYNRKKKFFSFQNKKTLGYIHEQIEFFEKIYKVKGLKPTKEINDATYDYRKQSDAYAMFMDDYFHKDEDEVCIKLDDSYSVFKDWYSLEFNDKAPPRREFKSYVERKLNQPYGRGNKSGWYGWS